MSFDTGVDHVIARDVQLLSQLVLLQHITCYGASLRVEGSRCVLGKGSYDRQGQGSGF